jgi:DNA-binding NtrC family response regulator
MELPPLRERPEDLEPLLEHFIQQFNQRHGLDVKLCVPELLATLRRYEWPGNVRELENLVERACILKGDGPLDGEDVPAHVRGQRAPTRGNGSGYTLPEDGIDFYGAVEEFENSLIMQALERTNGNKNKAAAVLSLNRTTLVEKLKKKGLM